VGVVNGRRPHPPDDEGIAAEAKRASFASKS
jgi:hypothetical protein